MTNDDKEKREEERKYKEKIEKEKREEERKYKEKIKEEAKKEKAKERRKEFAYKTAGKAAGSGIVWTIAILGVGYLLLSSWGILGEGSDSNWEPMSEEEWLRIRKFLDDEQILNY